MLTKGSTAGVGTFAIIPYLCGHMIFLQLSIMEISLFSSFTQKRPQDSTLQAVAELIRCDARIQSITESYRATGEKAVKESSPLFGVAALFHGGKRKEHIERLTGLSLVDVDHIMESEECGSLDVLKRLACEDPHTLLCYVTISGKGLRIVFRYELDTSFSLERQMQWYPKVFAAGNAYYAKLLGVQPDLQCKNVGRLSGLAHDAEVFFNPEAAAFTASEIEAEWQPLASSRKAERKHLRERKRLQACYERTIRPEVEADGAAYVPGRHNDYVMRVGYKLNQFGFEEGAAVAWASEVFADYDQTEEVIRACYRRTEEHGRRPFSQEGAASRGGRGGGNAAVEDIRAFLKEHVELRHNVITSRVEYHWDGEQEAEAMTGDGWHPITDRVVNSLWAAMSLSARVNVQDIYRVIESDFVPEFHPFQEYLEKVKSEKHISQESAISRLAATVTVKGGEDEQRRWETYLRKWLVGMVAGWVGHDVVNHVILVLIGEQGAFKTTWFQYLLPPELRRYFYTKTNAGRMNRDDLLTLAQYGLICCEELDTMRPSELNQLKAAVTMPAVDERAAYAHFHEHRKHIASFCATGNNAQFLSDATGNRRWLPFEVVRIRSPREQPFDYAGIYAEAYNLYSEGFCYWFSKEEIAALAEHNRQFETPRLEVELVQQYFRVPAEGEAGEFMPVATAMQMISANITQKLSPVMMGRAFRELGFEQRVVRNVRGYIVVRFTLQEMQARRELAARL